MVRLDPGAISFIQSEGDYDHDDSNDNYDYDDNDDNYDDDDDKVFTIDLVRLVDWWAGGLVGWLAGGP